MIHVQGHKVKFQTAITPPRIARFRSNLVQSLFMAQPTHNEYSRSKVEGQGHRVKRQRSRSERNVTYKQEKRSKTAKDRLSEFKLCTGDEIKADRDCAASGCLDAMP